MLRYAITNRHFGRRGIDLQSEPDSRAGLVDQARHLAADGIDFLQLREKDLPAKELIGLTRQIITAVRGSSPSGNSSMRVLVNGRADVALAAGADGVHLPAGAAQLTAAQLKQLTAGPNIAKLIVSVACHTLEEVREASGEGADLILFSPVFGKQVPEGETLSGTGLTRLAQACALAGATPVLALGGVTHEEAPACIAAGAKGIAGIRLFQLPRGRLSGKR